MKRSHSLLFCVCFLSLDRRFAIAGTQKWSLLHKFASLFSSTPEFEEKFTDSSIRLIGIRVLEGDVLQFFYEDTGYLMGENLFTRGLKVYDDWTGGYLREYHVWEELNKIPGTYIYGSSVGYCLYVHNNFNKCFGLSENRSFSGLPISSFGNDDLYTMTSHFSDWQIDIEQKDDSEAASSSTNLTAWQIKFGGFITRDIILLFQSSGQLFVLKCEQFPCAFKLECLQEASNILELLHPMSEFMVNFLLHYRYLFLGIDFIVALILFNIKATIGMCKCGGNRRQIIYNNKSELEIPRTLPEMGRAPEVYGFSKHCSSPSISTTKSRSVFGRKT